jgi:hypothetical protein
LAGKGFLVTHSDLDGTKEELTVKRYVSETIKHFLKFLRHVLNDAVLIGKLKKNPLANFDMSKVSQGRTRFFLSWRKKLPC